MTDSTHFYKIQDDKNTILAVGYHASKYIHNALKHFKKTHPDIERSDLLTIDIIEEFAYDDPAQLKEQKRYYIELYKPRYNVREPVVKTPFDTLYRKLIKLQQKTADMPDNEINEYIKDALKLLG